MARNPGKENQHLHSSIQGISEKITISSTLD